MSKYDIIIIGSGLGGLECGAILSKEGYHVCVLEKNELFGGCFQTYQRSGHRMDTGIHYIGSLDEGQIMNQYFRYFGIMDKLSIKRMDEEVFDRIYYKDAIYDYAMGHERFMETLCHSFPHERENLKRYVAAIRIGGKPDQHRPPEKRPPVPRRHGFLCHLSSRDDSIRYHEQGFTECTCRNLPALWRDQK